MLKESKNKNIVSIYLRPDELEYLRRICERTGRKQSAYFRGLLNAERFGVDQQEMDLDVSKNNLPLLYRKIAELENRLLELENNVQDL